MRRWMPGTLFALVLTGTTAANLRVSGQLISTEETDPPLQVESSAKVDNLNADLLDGLDATDLVTVTDLESSSTLYRQVAYSDPGEFEFEVPTDVTLVEVMLVGGGGGGGSGGACGAGLNLFECAGGGGGSGYVVRTRCMSRPAVFC